MGSSLQEQLLKAGLVTEQQLRREKARGAEALRRDKKNRKAPHAAQRRNPQSRATADHNPKRESPAGATQTALGHPEKREQAASASDQKLLRTRIKILLRRHRLNDPEAETPYHFVLGKHIRRIYVTDAQHALLCQGQLVVIPFGERHYLVSADKLRSLQQLDPKLTIITHNAASAAEAEGDDPYAGYRVPDDLIW